ncbi:MAG TPA: pseudouridine synthase [Vicinamibacterales bacterium]|jgi:pseudouridine synthase|nr:pseudouridine synthase [Vicinamibacterales bacterium]
MSEERLQKIISAAGVASRRAAEELITQGRVEVNGKTVRTLGTKADPDEDEIKVDGRRIKQQKRKRYILLYKPRGYVTTRSDPEGRATVMDLLQGVKEYVYPVGRLDYDSEGLLLLTNDGDLAARLMHPSHEIEKVYEARVRGVPAPEDLERLAKGVVLDGKRTAPAKIRLADRPGKTTESGVEQTFVEVILREGRQRQVRRMFESIGHPVGRLRRVRIGPIVDEQIPIGHWRDLDEQELAKLRRAARLAPAPHAAATSPPARRKKPSKSAKPE